MKIEIENYRGWSISFDTDLEIFFCYSERLDKAEHKKSFSATKKFIDEFIKDNQDFKAVWFEAKPTIYSDGRKIKLVGLRKDRLFIYEDEKGQKSHLSLSSEKNYILFDEKNNIYKNEVSQIEKEIDELRKKRNEVLAEIKGIELQEYKKRYTN